MTDEFITRKDCDQKHEATMSLLNEINNRLFKDNGNISIQTRLDRHEQFLKIVNWALGILGSTVLVGSVGVVVAIVKHVF